MACWHHSTPTPLMSVNNSSSAALHIVLTDVVPKYCKYKLAPISISWRRFQVIISGMSTSPLGDCHLHLLLPEEVVPLPPEDLPVPALSHHHHYDRTDDRPHATADKGLLRWPRTSTGSSAGDTKIRKRRQEPTRNTLPCRA